MPPDKERRPRREDREGGGVRDDGAGGNVNSIVLRATLTGCPCGCMTRLPWLDDPGCIRHRPLPAARAWGGYDVITLGLVPHPRETCGSCQAVGR
jgi:hypothetical protein